jgi:hypothetical protein
VFLPLPLGHLKNVSVRISARNTAIDDFTFVRVVKVRKEILDNRFFALEMPARL